MDTTPHTLIFGTSANPLHMGHVALLTGAIKALLAREYALQRAVILPVYRRNPKAGRKDGLSDSYLRRLAMCALSAETIQSQIDGIPILVSSIESELVAGTQRPNYTVETLNEMRARGDQNTYFFLLSSEIFSGEAPQFERWHNIDGLMATTALAICHRPGYRPNLDYLQSLRERGATIEFLDEVNTPNVSSTEIRAMIAAGTSPVQLANKGLILPIVAQLL